MKKIILIIAVACFIASNSIGQYNASDVREELQFGLKIGANYSNVYDAVGEEFNTDGKIGLATGIFMSIPIGKYLGIQPELLFSQKGFRADGRILDFPYELRRTSYFLDVPLLLSLKPSAYFTLLIGPQFSYLMKQKDKYANSTQEQVFNNNNIRKNILCFLGGLDINLDHAVFGARVGWDIQDNKGDGTSTSPRYKNVWYQATLGYRFYE